MNRQWQKLSCLSLCACLMFTGCGNALNGNTKAVTEGNTSQVETTDKEVGQAPGEENISVENENEPKGYLNDLQPPEGIDYIIGSENFVTDTDKLYNNLPDYIGKTLQYEGMVTQLEEGRTAIIRLYDLPHEEHGHEIYVGLDAVYQEAWPKEKTWVRVTGVIEEGVDEVSGEVYPILQVLTLEEIPAGQEKVYN